MKEARNNLSKAQKIRLLFDFYHRTTMHYAMWFAEVRHQMGTEKAYEVFGDVYDKSFGLQMSRIAKTLDLELEDGLPKVMLELEDEKIENLTKALSVNWLANDGIWFQGVEFKHGMHNAKRANDTCWAHFSPFEAWSIKKYLNLSENPGLEGLKKALEFRLYAYVNEQEIVDETDNSFEFRMNKCRVQAARNRKGMDDYPCKSGGLVEYTTFAETIDSRIKTECIACPPDKHPEEWYCAWRFSIEG